MVFAILGISLVDLEPCILDKNCHFLKLCTSFHVNSDTPACAQGQQQIYEAAKLQEIQISCYMNANPQDNIDFSWSFNNSANLMDIPVKWLFATFLISIHTLVLERRCQICWPIKQNKLYSKN